MHQIAVTGQGAATGGGANSYQAVANSTGNSTITPTTSNETVAVTVTGSAGTRIFILDTTGRSAGDRVSLRFIQPATASIVEAVRNATAGGTLLYSYTTDGTAADNLVCELYYDGSAWKPLANIAPVV